MYPTEGIYIYIQLCPQMVSGHLGTLKNQKQDFFHLKISELAQRYNQHLVPDHVGLYLSAQQVHVEPL